MAELVKYEAKIKQLGEAILSWEKQLTSVLPSHMDTNRMMRLVYNVVRRTPKLLECSYDSIIGGMLEAAYLGLEPSVGGQCWLIPFKGEAQMIAGYRGLVQLALRSDQVSMLYANAVYDKDRFKHQNYPRILEHDRHELTEDDNDPGNLIGAYSIVSMHAGGEYWNWMNASEIMSIKKRSPGAKMPQSPWNSSEVYVRAEMWKKTALRRHCKVLPMSIEYNRLADLDSRADMQMPQDLGDNLEAAKQSFVAEEPDDKATQEQL